MIVSTAIISMAIFMGGLWIFGVARIGTDVLHLARHALASVRDKDVDDAAREKAARRASLQLFSAFFSILCRSAVTLLVAFMPIWLADFTELARARDVIEFLLRWDVILIGAMVLIVAYSARQRISLDK